jgi:GNAT superfamily N-acetyltransferase
MATTEPVIGAPLAASELADADALVRAAGWNQVAADWETFLKLGTVFAARDSGRVVATAAILPYGEFAWVSMVLVLPDYRRYGLGTRLLKRCTTELERQGRVPVLDATPAGQPLYQAMGFRETWGFQRLAAASVRAIAPPLRAEGVTVRPIGEGDWAELCAYDAVAFGADRGALLQRLRGRLPEAELVARRGGRIAGFMLGRDGRSASQIGPLVAEDAATAFSLLERAIAAINGPIYLDLADSKEDIGEWLMRCGFVSQRPLTRMVLGRSQGFDDEARTFMVVGPEFG